MSPAGITAEGTNSAAKNSADLAKDFGARWAVSMPGSSPAPGDGSVWVPTAVEPLKSASWAATPKDLTDR
ncbi:hypothetical protein [Arthrobacter sp. 18067]|uniref:hypothetical protein n=1 Tax=Arthrobacter sp. 18067 TaxID=2681413 RepID=UPI001F1849E4|nr:hypothetical protein [Arthrobacter sp. 18067]